MNPAGTADPKAQGDAANKQPATKPGDPVVPCLSCSVSLAPSPVSLCKIKAEKQVKATGTPGGGAYAWSIEEPTIATVTGAGAKAKVKAVKTGKTKVKVTYSVAGCTCTAEADVKVCTCTPGRKYAHGYRNLANVIGVRAKIKTRYGKVACEDEGCSTESAYHVVYANISNSTGKLIWAQSGWGRERNPGGTAVHEYRYAEMNGATYKVNYDTANAPAEGSVHLYQVVLDSKTGKWTYTQDGAEWQTYADNSWKGKVGTVIQYTGEIFNKEDDMPGTAADKCEFTECQYLLQAPVPPPPPADTILSNFGFDKSDITPEQQAQIDAIAEKIFQSYQTPPEIVAAKLVGHTDPVGSAGYNIGLGQRRAQAANEALVDALEAKEAGLSGKVAISTESKGESQLIDKSGTDAGNAKNRRVEVFLRTKAAGDDWKDAGLVAGNVTSDDAGEWGAEWVSGTALNIWDKDPLP